MGLSQDDLRGSLAWLGVLGACSPLIGTGEARLASKITGGWLRALGSQPSVGDMGLAVTNVVCVGTVGDGEWATRAPWLSGGACSKNLAGPGIMNTPGQVEGSIDGSTAVAKLADSSVVEELLEDSRPWNLKL